MILAFAHCNTRTYSSSKPGSFFETPACISLQRRISVCRPTGDQIVTASMSDAVHPVELTAVERTAQQVSWFRWKATMGSPEWQGSYPPPASLYDSSFDQLLCSSLPEDVLQQLEERAKNMIGMMAVRTVSLDDTLMRATGGPAVEGQGAGGGSAAAPVRQPKALSGLPIANIRQVVILGAGLDARPWRLAWPAGVNVYEVDSGTTEALKSRLLAPFPLRCASRHALVADLGQPELLGQVLTGAGFDASLPAVWVMEGLIGYLTTEAALNLLRAVHDLSAPGSQLLMTCPPQPSVRDQNRTDGIKLYHTTYEEPEEAYARVVAAGWSKAELVSGSTLEQAYGHPCWQPQVHALR